MKIVNADALRTLLIKAGKDPHGEITEQDLLELGFKPTNAWVSEDGNGDFVVLDVKGGIHGYGIAFWPI